MPLLTFLNLHEQNQIEFSAVEKLRRISAINLGASANVTMLKNVILVNDQGKAKINYTVELQYKNYPTEIATPAQGDSLLPKLDFDESILPSEKLTILKTYGDFKRL